MSIPWHSLKTGDVFKKLKTTKDGISSGEARERLRIYGHNELTQTKKINKWKLFLEQFKSILIAILLVAAVISIFIENWIDSVVIFVIIVLNAVLGFREEYNAEKAMEALKKLTNPTSIVLRDGRKTEIDSRLLVPGDVVVLEEGTKVPADIRLIETSDLRIDEASLTGESIPVSKEACTLPEETQIADRKNMAFTGTVVTSGRGIGVVVTTGMETEIGKIARMVQTEKKEETPLQKKLGEFGRKLGVLILAICAVIIVVGLIRGEPFMTMFMTGIALAVAAIPEGLPAVVTITLAVGLKIMANRNAIVRKLSAVETLGCTTVICTDKTGTLTRNEMTVSEIYANEQRVSVSGSGYTPKGTFIAKGKKIDPREDEALKLTLINGALCNNAELRRGEHQWEIIGDPTEGALLVSAAKAMDIHRLVSEYKRLKEIPFSSERKMMSVLVSDKNGKKYVFSKGAVEVILGLCTHIMKRGRVYKLTRADVEKIRNANKSMTGKALRVLAFAFKETSDADKSELEKGLVFLGLQGMIDQPREGVKEDIATCKKAGIDVIMITGDHKDTAVAIAKELKIIEKKNQHVLTGEELDRMSEDDLLEVIESVKVYARVNPLHKVKILKALKRKGHVVAMTGDGVNDSPALKSADIGVAMGIKGTDVAKESSDMILKDDNFSTIVKAVESGRAIYDNIVKFIQYLLSSNLGEVLVVFIAMMIGFRDQTTGLVIIPVSAIQLLWINLLTDGLPAVALGVDPPAKDIMKRKPRDPKEDILNRSMLFDIFFIGILMCIGTLFLFVINIPEGSQKARTVAFTLLVVLEMVRVQSVRLKYKVGVFSNMKLIYAITASLLLQLVVLYIPLLQTAFGTVPLNTVDWIEISAISLLMFVIIMIKDRVAVKLKSI
ncbi:MAG: calcium-translocating P-type ATPase, SERCA-type [Candidatus Aenigmarchaeota archaeon]|nr:calcium-translocating P-type ATPase, SERCA-type [Candidatus Aenigmarchaeota archaeon]